MAKMKHFVYDMPLRRAFITYVFLCLAGALVLSLITIFGCLSVRTWLLPETEQAVLSLKMQGADGSQMEEVVYLQKGEQIPFLTAVGDGNDSQITSGNNDFRIDESYSPKLISYSFDQVKRDYHILTPKRRLLYMASGAAMVIMPVFYCTVGILVCAFLFYRHKLKEPLYLLETAAENIARQDLDFSLSYQSKDEFGKLCVSFEKMRSALLQANRNMWKMLEEKQILQASIAHDLRNPISIIKGYAEYLQINLPNGTVSTEQSLLIADSLAACAGRLERYTDSVRNIDELEALEINPHPCSLKQFLDSTAEDMRILAAKSKISLNCSCPITEMEGNLDTESYSRVLENIFQNALRFAKKEVRLSWELKEGILVTIVTDDGPGFPEKLLKRKKYAVSPTDSGHMGIGLAVSDILCRKHGGELELYNIENGGARVQFTFCVRKK